MHAAMCCMHPWPALPRGGCSRCPCSTHTVAVAMRALSTPPTWLLFAPGALYGIGQPNANHIHQVGPAGPAGGGQRWPKDKLWHVGPFGTQSTILAKMRTLKILGTKVPQVLCCHMWNVVCLTWMWDSLIGQSEITRFFFRQGLRCPFII